MSQVRWSDGASKLKMATQFGFHRRLGLSTKYHHFGPTIMALPEGHKNGSQQAPTLTNHNGYGRTYLLKRGGGVKSVLQKANNPHLK